LYYFDPVRQIIVDPMHCIFLGTSSHHPAQIQTNLHPPGIMKTQWFDGWIKEPNMALRKRTELKDRELDQIHEYLKIVSHLS
jgi:hypothetical protein